MSCICFTCQHDRLPECPKMLKKDEKQVERKVLINLIGTYKRGLKGSYASVAGLTDWLESGMPYSDDEKGPNWTT